MEQYNMIDHWHQEINNNCFDLKAETLLAFAVESGLSPEDFMIACKGHFYRPYSKDIMASEIIEDAQLNKYLQLYLSRSGLYDHLPQGMFFQPRNTDHLTASEMAADYKKNKQKEIGIRNFFMPIENEFLWQRIQMESEEINLMEGLNSDLLRAYFTQFWSISPSIQEQLVTGLISILPYVHKMAGSPEIISKCLAQLLREKVSAKIVVSKVTQQQDENMLRLNQVQLGVNMICGSEIHDDQPLMELTIGPLNHSKIKDYLPAGEKVEFLQAFLSFFIPVGMDITIKIEQGKEEMHLQIEEEPILGFCFLSDDSF